MPDPLSSAILIANPTLNADPERYSSHDGVGNINRFVQQLRFFLPWQRIAGQFLEIRGHDPGAIDVQANFYNHETTTAALQPIPSSAYEFASSTEPPTQRIALKEITAYFDMRMFSQELLSREFNQIRFQKRALKHAICARLEFGLINGDSSTNVAQFDGLHRLVGRGMGQQITAEPNDDLNILNRAMTRIRSHNRRVNLIVMNQDAWLRVLELQRARGFRPQFIYNRKLRQRILYIDGVPVCLSDHIATRAEATARTSSIFFLTFGRNGVFGVNSRKRPGIYFTQTSQPNSPFKAYQAHLFCGLASTTSDALVEVVNWNVNLANP
ncbi:MAG TPA: hypothetical protein VJ810_04580 [Blastocatellia bacterium]|nr:hypothetical protein [Blastocatellia bacterium]